MLVQDPALIILDEPNAALDDAGLSALLSAMNILKKQGKTIVLITHHKPLLSVTDKLLLLAGGRMQLLGPSEKVIETLNNQAGKNNDH